MQRWRNLLSMIVAVIVMGNFGDEVRSMNLLVLGGGNSQEKTVTIGNIVVTSAETSCWRAFGRGVEWQLLGIRFVWPKF